MIDITEDLNKILENSSNGAILYGSYVLSGDLKKIGDLDILNISNLDRHDRLVKSYQDVEIHEYCMSVEFLKHDIADAVYGNSHTCALWGPRIVLNDTIALNEITKYARQKKIIETINYAHILGISKFTLSMLAEMIYLTEAPYQPHTINLARKISVAVKEGKNQFVSMWLAELAEIMHSKEVSRLVVKRGNTFEVIKSELPESTIAIHTRKYAEMLNYWKEQTKTHSGWPGAYKQALKHTKDIDQLDEYIERYIK